MEGKQYLATRSLIGFAAKVHKTQRRAGKLWEGVGRWWGLEDVFGPSQWRLSSMEIVAALSELRQRLCFHYA